VPRSIAHDIVQLLVAGPAGARADCRRIGEKSPEQGREGCTTFAHISRAMTLAEELRMRPLVAHCHLDLGQLHRRTGEGPEASEHLTTAIALYREMGMSFWPERALAEMADPAPPAA
jgi:hypothetical protein